MNSLFQPYLKKFVLVIFDNILIYSCNWQKNLQHLTTVFEVLKQQQQLFAKFSKYIFGKSKIEYLDHIITGGVATNSAKIKLMSTWHVPKFVKELKSFLGLTSYYKKFVHYYGIIC